MSDEAKKNKVHSETENKTDEQASKISSITGIRYLSPEDAVFAKTEGGFLSLLIIKREGETLSKEADLENRDSETEPKTEPKAAKEEGVADKEADGEEESGDTEGEIKDENEGKGGKDEKYDRVGLHRAFPFNYEREYISVRTTEGKEIGMIRNIDDYPANIVEIFLYELDRRYFTPYIQKINSIKEEFGYTYWDVLTDSGPRRFTVQNIHNNLIQISDVRILVLDVDGNRFEIPDSAKLDVKSLKMIERLL